MRERIIVRMWKGMCGQAVGSVRITGSRYCRGERVQER